jgi:hypothetical protein
MFDPERAAVFLASHGNREEAIWLVFLSTACGKHGRNGWRLVADIYGKLGSNRDHWSWQAVEGNPEAFRQWLADIDERFRADGISRRFGNHRKYSNLTQVGEAVESYVQWVSSFGGQGAMVDAASAQSEGDPRQAFDYLYRSMRPAVKFFGRLGCFDFLASLGKLGLAPIEPGSTYMSGATGPVGGATLLFGGSLPARKFRASELDRWLAELDEVLQVGMQALEDSLCNWQKSSEEFRAFRG